MKTLSKIISALLLFSVVSVTTMAQEVRTIKRKVAIGRFSNETQYAKGLFYDKENDPMRKQAMDILSTKLAASEKFILLERDDLSVLVEEGGASMNKIGADYIILGSITEFGRKVIAEMNRVGMMIDLSHAAESSFYQAIQVSRTPIVCSHSSARALCDHPRNLTDDQLRAIEDTKRDMESNKIMDRLICGDVGYGKTEVSLRAAMKAGTPVGLKAKEYVESGRLVPDEVILGIVAERVAQPDCAKGFILDGVPRTLAQAEALDAKGVRIDHVVSIEIDDSVIEGRMTGRRVCGKSGASYHVTANPPKSEGICDQGGSELMIRKDDAPETVRRRLQVYHEQTEVLKDFYAKKGLLKIVEGQEKLEDTTALTFKALENA